MIIALIYFVIGSACWLAVTESMMKKADKHGVAHLKTVVVVLAALWPLLLAFLLWCWLVYLWKRLLNS